MYQDGLDGAVLKHRMGEMIQLFENIIESTLIPPMAPSKMETVVDFNEHTVTVCNISSCIQDINVFPTSPPRRAISPLFSSSVLKLGKAPQLSSSNTVASKKFFAKESDAAEESRLFHQFTTDENRFLLRSATAQDTLIFPEGPSQDSPQDKSTFQPQEGLTPQALGAGLPTPVTKPRRVRGSSSPSSGRVVIKRQRHTPARFR